MNKIKNFGLIVNPNIDFPLNSNKYKTSKNCIYKVNDNNPIDKELIYSHKDFDTTYELQLRYNVK